MKRIYCLNPDEQEKECENHAYRYLGHIPNTGPQACIFCGARKTEPRRNRHEIPSARLSDGTGVPLVQW